MDKEVILGRNKTHGLHKDNSGLYTVIREIIVAATNTHDNELFDWAAYQGFVTEHVYLMIAKDIIAAHGDKLIAEEAILIFPQFPLEKYR
ncbi:hypothetical protein LCGC14_1104220 [marine sediment metagenome]|uniref:Uncharacterized protein n=1 Tax=marine sediment metagenome TaxID=412755 RepID=A0A0F9M8Q0_9ZZZZ